MLISSGACLCSAPSSDFSPPNTLQRPWARPSLQAISYVAPRCKFKPLTWRHIWSQHYCPSLPSSPMGTAAFKWPQPVSHVLMFKSLVDCALCTGKRNISWICLRRILLHSSAFSVILMQHWPDNKILNIEYELLKSQMSSVLRGRRHHPF